MDRLGLPLTEPGQGLAQRREDGCRPGLEVLACRLLVVALRLTEEEQAVLRHLPQGLCTLGLRTDQGLQRRSPGRIDTHLAQVPGQVACHVGRVAGLHVVLVQPLELGAVEAGSGVVDVVDVEELDELIQGEDLLVPVGPSQPREIVQHRLGQVALIAVVHDARRAGALGQLLAVLVQDHRHVGVHRRLHAQGLEDVHLARGIVDVVVAADDMADAHVHVVHHHDEVVRRRAVGTGDDEVVELAVGEHDAALHPVVDHRLPLQRGPETDHRVSTRVRRRLGEVTAAPVVAGLLLARHLRLAQRLQPLAGAVAAIRPALLQEAVDHLRVAVEALGLVERPLVVVESEPGHALEDRIDRLGGGALTVGILDAQHEVAAVPPGIQPGEQRRACTTDMEIAGGTGGETGLYGHVRLPEKGVRTRARSAGPAAAERPVMLATHGAKAKRERAPER